MDIDYVHRPIMNSRHRGISSYTYMCDHTHICTLIKRPYTRLRDGSARRDGSDTLTHARDGSARHARIRWPLHSYTICPYMQRIRKKPYAVQGWSIQRMSDTRHWHWYHTQILHSFTLVDRLSTSSRHKTLTLVDRKEGVESLRSGECEDSRV